MAKKKDTTDQQAFIEIEAVSELTTEVFLLGTTPLLYNKPSQKAWRELLMPSPPKNRAEKAMRLKHQPYNEYRASVYRTRDEDAPTRLFFPGGAFRRALASSALDIPGCKKAEIGRLVRVVEHDVSIFGTPQISCMIARMADQKRTPDVRTRAIVPEWCCQLSLRFPHPLLKEKAVLSLLVFAGEHVGIGDGRNEKGALSFGCFEIVQPNDPRWLRIRAEQGRVAQDAALESPACYDQETEELLQWFDEELVRRDQQPAAAPSRNNRPKKEQVEA